MQKFKFSHNSRITAPEAQVYQNRETESSLCLWAINPGFTQVHVFKISGKIHLKYSQDKCGEEFPNIRRFSRASVRKFAPAADIVTADTVVQLGRLIIGLPARPWYTFSRINPPPGEIRKFDRKKQRFVAMGWGNFFFTVLKILLYE